MRDESPALLSVGAVLGGSVARDDAWRPLVNRLQRAIVAARPATPVGPLCVNVVLMLSGRLVEHEFTGVRTGRYDRAAAHLMVQAKVPDDADETHPDDASRLALLCRLLGDAVTEAEASARRRRIADALPEVRAVAERATAALGVVGS